MTSRAEGAEGPEHVTERLAPIAAAFSDGTVTNAGTLGRGLIHQTWAVRCEAPQGSLQLVIQRINTDIFRDPSRLMENILRTTEHLRASLAREAIPQPERHCLRIVPTRAGELLHRDPAGGVWRAFHRIENAVSFQRPSGPAQAEEAAREFGRFARRLADLPGPPLHETLPRFHDFPARLAALERAAQGDRHARAGAVQSELEALFRHSRAVQSALADSGFAGLPRRVVHHDCKLDNLLFDAEGKRALCVIDLDTVMPGNLLSDFGELVRSSTNTGSEDGRDAHALGFDLEIYAALARGYLDEVGPLLTEAERRTLPLSGPLLSLMNGVRFLTDHLEGDVYFRIEHPEQNLARARAQIRLATRMLANEDALHAAFI